MITVGIDEAGVGCWAGPIVVVSAAYRDNTELPKLVRDSKKLSKAQRNQIVGQLCGLSQWVVIGMAMPSYIDRIQNIWTVWDVLARTIVQQNQDLVVDRIVVDGTRRIQDTMGVEYMVKADQKVREVSAASIVAKFVQTSVMMTYHQEFHQHGFDKHHGYGTAQHLAAMKQHGITRIHRRSYRPVQALACHFELPPPDPVLEPQILIINGNDKNSV